MIDPLFEELRREIHERIQSMKAVPIHLLSSLSVSDLVSDIATWPDAKFSADGHRYQLFLDGDSIFYRLLAKLGPDCMEPEAEGLKSIAGIIIELNNPAAAPLVFTDRNQCLQCWVDLHAVYGAPLNPDEEIAFGEFQPAIAEGILPN